MEQFVHFILHIDKFLIPFVAEFGHWSYLVLFLIIFCETGLVVTPFLPGDSLLFAAGSLAGHSQAPLNIFALLCLLMMASIAGNQLNYIIGRQIGEKLLFKPTSRYFNKNHFAKAHAFYEANGGKAIIIARFIPIIRTFAPFVAGVSKMNHLHYFIYNVISAVIWITSLLGAGYFFGAIPLVEEHFTLFIYGIALFSFLPSLGFIFKKTHVLHSHEGGDSR